jgi:8-oxo-dGTP diphosphatase
MSITYVAIGILINENNEILIEKNSTSTHFKGLWQFPGGKLEQNETPYVALERELKEELNIKTNKEHASPILFVEYELKDIEKQYVLFFYICKKWDGEINNNLNQEIKWVSLEDLKNMPILPYNKPVINKLYDL